MIGPGQARTLPAAGSVRALVPRHHPHCQRIESPIIAGLATSRLDAVPLAQVLQPERVQGDAALAMPDDNSPTRTSKELHSNRTLGGGTLIFARSATRDRDPRTNP